MFPSDYVCGKVLNACAKNGYFNGHVPISLLQWGLCLRDYVEHSCPKAQNTLKKAHGPPKGQLHQSLAGKILPQFDLNNLSVASKLGKLEKRPINTLKKAQGPHKGLPIWGRPVDNSTNQFLAKFYPNLIFCVRSSSFFG